MRTDEQPCLSMKTVDNRFVDDLTTLDCLRVDQKDTKVVAV